MEGDELCEEPDEAAEVEDGADVEEDILVLVAKDDIDPATKTLVDDAGELVVLDSGGGLIKLK